MNHQNYTDEQLWNRFREGDVAAFATLLKRHQGRIIGALYFLVNQQQKTSLDVVKDAFQEMATKIIAQQEKHAEINVRDFPNWAIQYSFNIWRNQSQKERNRLRLNREKLLPDRNYYEIDVLLHKNLDRVKFIRCIDQIENETYQQLIRLIYVNHFDNKELAEHFGKPKHWIADKKYRAIKAYKKVLVRNGLVNK